MKLARIAAIAAILTLAGTTVALATTDDHGRRLAGPFCVSLSTGVVRAVAVNQPCKTGEVRKVGLAIPDVDLPPVPGPAGATGPQGPPGPQGNGGGQGPAGQVHVEQITEGDQAGCVKITGSDGSTGVVCAPPCNCKCELDKPAWHGGYDSLKPS